MTRSRRCGAVKGEFLEVLQWLPEQQCEELGDRPEEGCTLEQLLVLGSGGGFYVYDFGDSWLHHLELVSRRPADENSLPARLIDGARRGPLGDSGGLPGYEEIMDVLDGLNSSNPGELGKKTPRTKVASSPSNAYSPAYFLERR